MNSSQGIYKVTGAAHAVTFYSSNLATNFQQLTVLHARSQTYFPLVKETSHLWEKPTFLSP
jgi:hypothetical protein